MDRLTNMAVFARVAATGSFSFAARELGISQATASKHVQMLEGWLGARLLDRTTRHVALSEVGKTFYAQCNRILEDMEAARLLGKPDAILHGTVHMAAPVAFGSTRLGALSVAFMRRNPQLALHITLVDRAVDVIDEGYDVAMRVAREGSHGVEEHPGVIVQPLMPMPYVVCAAPSYLASAGTPETPVALASHACLTDSRHPGDIWRFVGPEGDYEVAIDGRFRSDNGLLRREATIAGAGIALLPEALVRDDLATGRLTLVLPGIAPKATSLQVVYPAARATLPKVQALLTFLTAELTGPS